MTFKLQCLSCARFIDDKNFTCEAFANGIPDAIILNQHDHKDAIDGDGGLRYKRKEQAA